MADINYSYIKLLRKDIILIPSVGISWFNKEHNQYYYGVTDKESKRSGLAPFYSKSGFTLHLGMTSVFILNKEWNIFWVPA